MNFTGITIADSGRLAQLVTGQGNNQYTRASDFNGLILTLNTLNSVLPDYADDAAAATGGIPVGGLYRSTSTIKVRVA
jgi:UDP-N-acetylenolpyruvoylglucosamine reductase